MSFISEFKEFAMKGNVVDMAVGIIIGAAFGKIISVMVDKVIMPPIGLLIGGVNFRDLAFTLKPAEGQQPAVVVGYGEFLQTVFDFTIIALAIFMMIKALNKLKRQAPPPPAARPSRAKRRSFSPKSGISARALAEAASTAATRNRDRAFTLHPPSRPLIERSAVRGQDCPSTMRLNTLPSKQ